MALKPSALSEDGFIIDQRQTDNIPFGRSASDKNGCGWIAIYNFLRALEQTADPEDLTDRLGKTLFPSSRLGLNFFVLVHELRRRGVPLEFSLRPFHTGLLSETCPAGIILYRAGRTNHFCTFRREPEGTLRFFGVLPGQSHHRMSMAEFYWDYVKFPLTLTITAQSGTFLVSKENCP